MHAMIYSCSLETPILNSCVQFIARQRDDTFEVCMDCQLNIPHEILNGEVTQKNNTFVDVYCFKVLKSHVCGM